MKRTFQKYSDPENWGCWRSFEATYLPDEIIEPVLEALREKASGTIQYVDFLKRQEKTLTRRQKWDWPSVMAFTQELWGTFSETYAAEINKSFEEGKFRIGDKTPDKITSVCTIDVVDMYLDGTLNDPVYTAHESGHLLAYRLAANQQDKDQQKNIAEIQAFFAQEAAYEHLVKIADTDEQKSAAKLHRLTEYMVAAGEIPYYLWALGKDQNSSNDISLRDSFHAWQVEDEAWINCIQGWHNEKKEPDSFTAQRLHNHPFAVLITPDLYQRYKSASAPQQENMLATLYTGGYKTRIADILKAFDIRTRKDLKQCALNTLMSLEREIKELAIIHPTGERILQPY